MPVLCSPVAVAVADSTADDAFLGCNLLERSRELNCKQSHSFSCEERGEESGLPRMTRPEDGIGMWVQLTTLMQTPKPVEQPADEIHQITLLYSTITKDLATLNSTIKQGFSDPFPCLPTFRDTEFTSWLSN